MRWSTLFAADLLEEAGFEVIEAPSGDYAALVLAKRGDIRVVFTDVEMPGQLNGFQLATMVHNVYKGVGVVIGSGRAGPRLGDIPSNAIFPVEALHAFRLAGSSYEGQSPALNRQISGTGSP